MPLNAEQVRALALELGFDAVGISAAGPIPEGSYFRDWLADGRHASMDYMARDPDARLDPTRLDSRFASVLTVAMSYWRPLPTAAGPPGVEVAPPVDVRAAPGGDPGGEPAGAAGAGRPAGTADASGADDRPRGRIARYAWGADYHNVLGKRLRKLVARLREASPGLVTRLSVDTGPVMDRAWAARAGVGWWGKHTNLVSREHGSWLLLGTLLLDQDLAPDTPHADYCGSCRRCIDACPTRAIVADRQLDARLCISYWTIEHRGAIPIELRPLIGNWIFGCDLCLDVCPWNRFAREGREARFAVREDRAAPALLPLLFLTQEEFRRKFNGSPIQRTGRDGLVRNVCVALGNLPDAGPARAAEAVLALGQVAATDPSPMVREHAAWAILRLRAAG